MFQAATLTNPDTFSTYETSAGDLLVSGYLTKWDDVDKTGDRMLRGSFASAIPKFFSSGHRPLCYAHELKTQIGTVLDMHEDDYGVKMTAKVMYQPESSPFRWIYDAVRKKIISGLSVGGYFSRKDIGDGTKGIVDVSIIEASITGRPALDAAGFEVVSEGKSLDWGWPAPDSDLLGLRLAALDVKVSAASALLR